jgi:hypothetical protein
MTDDLPRTEDSSRESRDDKSQELLDAIRSLGTRRILLVVDRGLLQFGKFVLAQVAIFGIIGVFFFGADIKDALKEVRKVRDESELLRQELDNAKQYLQTSQDEFRAELESAKESVIDLRKQVEEADALLTGIRFLLGEAEQHVGIIKELTEEERSTLALLTESDFKTITRIKNLPDTATEIEKKQAETLHLWTNGTTLRVRFLDGTKDEQEKVKKIAREWTKHANIDFDFVESGDSHIRVTLRPKSSQMKWPAWAYQGTGSLGVSQDQPTIGLDIANELRMFGFANEEETRGNVLREFGFALGLTDEARNPTAQIPWDTEAFKEPMYQGRTPYSKSELPEYRKFDPNSVMFGGVYNTMTKGNFELIGRNYQLSESDKQLISKLYPRN